MVKWTLYIVAEEATKRELSLVSAMAKPRVVKFLNLGTISLKKLKSSHIRMYFVLQVILFEINCAIFYKNLHELFCHFIS